MKTLKALKIASILNGVFCFCCIAMTVCFTIDHYYDISAFYDLGYAFIYGWILYPVTIVSLIVCSVIFRKEKKSSDIDRVIRKKHIWIFVWPIITTALFLFSIMEFAWYVGGV